MHVFADSVRAMHVDGRVSLEFTAQLEDLRTVGGSSRNSEAVSEVGDLDLDTLELGGERGEPEEEGPEEEDVEWEEPGEDEEFESDSGGDGLPPLVAGPFELQGRGGNRFFADWEDRDVLAHHWAEEVLKNPLDFTHRDLAQATLLIEHARSKLERERFKHRFTGVDWVAESEIKFSDVDTLDLVWQGLDDELRESFLGLADLDAPDHAVPAAEETRASPPDPKRFRSDGLALELA